MNIKNLFQNRLIIIVIMMSILGLIALSYFIPQKIEKNIQESVVQNSKLLVEHIRIFRSYYTENIIQKVKHHTELKINFDHKVHNDTIPLPATMVHDLGDLFTQVSNIKIKMYSNYPFPHRSNRVLDTFEKESLAYLLKNPDKMYVKKDFYRQKNVIRVAVPDFLSSENCVQCHNTRSDSPKTDWKLGDMRGVIEVITPIDDQLASNNEVIWYIVIFLFINVIVLIMIFIYLRQKELSVVNKQLTLMATTDHLTHIYNRRYFEEFAIHAIHESIRYNNPLSLILFDIDKFKMVNDTYGHQIGDEILVTISHTTKLLIRKSDIFARMGGEEFAILMPNTELSQASIVAEKLRLQIEQLEVFTNSNTVQCTISIGISEISDEINSLSKLLQNSDEKLYMAKNRGRNTIVA